MRRRLPVILLVLSLPAGLIGYTVALYVIQAVLPSLATTIVALFVPMLVAGVFMLPFIAPWFDAKAKQDLAHIQELKASGQEPPKRGHR